MQHLQYTIVMISYVNELPYIYLCLYIECGQICKKTPIKNIATLVNAEKL